MLIIEPPEVFIDRAEQRRREAECERREFLRKLANPHEHYDGFDLIIMNFFIGQPQMVILIMRAVNALAKQRRYGCKHHREEAKILIIRSIGRLIRERRLVRVRRRFVRVNAAEVPQKPIIPLGVVVPGAGNFEAKVAVGSTPGQVVINPGVFI